MVIGGSLTLVMGPEMEEPVERLFGEAPVELPECDDPPGLLDTNPAMVWLTPSARIKFSRSSRLVRPLAVDRQYKQNKTTAFFDL